MSAASTPTLLREVYTEISSAIDSKLIADATGRNALFKIHVSLGKIVNSLKDKEDESAGLRDSVREAGSLRSSVNSRKSGESVIPDVVEEEGGEEEVGEKTELEKVKEDEDEGTVVGGKRGVGDAMLDELLSDGDVEMSGL